MLAHEVGEDAGVGSEPGERDAEVRVDAWWALCELACQWRGRGGAGGEGIGTDDLLLVASELFCVPLGAPLVTRSLAGWMDGWLLSI